MPEPIVSLMRERIASRPTDADVVPHLVELCRDCEEAEDVPHRVRGLQTRILSSVMRCMSRKGMVDWNSVLQKMGPRDVLELFYTMRFSEEDVASAQALQKEYGKTFSAALLRKYKSHERFHETLSGALDQASLDCKDRMQQEEDAEVEALRQHLTLAESPDAMREVLRAKGLPGDCFRNNTWMGTLWKFQRYANSRSLRIAKKALRKDPRFTTLTVDQWLEPNAPAQAVHPGKLMHAISPVRTDVLTYIAGSIRMYPYEHLEKDEYSVTFPFARRDSPHPWAQLCACFNPKRADPADAALAESKAISTAVHKLGRALWDADRLTACERIDWCETPEDVLRLFRAVGISDERWKSRSWMETESVLSKEEGGIELDLWDLAYALDLRWQGYGNFIEWMKGDPLSQPAMLQTMRSCRSIRAFMTACQAFGIQNGRWKSAQWLLYRSLLPVEQGGIGRDMSAIVQGIEEHPYAKTFGIGEFHTYEDFVESVDPSLTCIEQAWDIVHEHCERWGMSVDELLMMKNIALIEKHPSLQAAMDAIHDFH